MATTISLVTACDSGANNWKLDNSTVGRIRQGQTYELTEFDSLSIPAGATIDGIELIMEGYASHATFGEDCFSVSNDDGSTFSTEQNVTTEPWSTSSTEGNWQVEIAGGDDELWGMTWNATTAAAIQVQVKVDASGQAFYLDYFKVQITYTAAAVQTTYTSDDQVILKNGILTLSSGTTTIK